MKKSDYMSDCVHLHACRRLCKMLKTGLEISFTRRCNEDCTAYKSKEGYVSIPMAINYIYDNVYMIRGGYDERDVFYEDDLRKYAEYHGDK